MKDVIGKVDKLGNFWDNSEVDAILIRYAPSLADTTRQAQVFDICNKKDYVSNTCKDIKH